MKEKNSSRKPTQNCLFCHKKIRVGFPNNKNLFKCEVYQDSRILLPTDNGFDCLYFEPLPHFETINGKTFEEWQKWKGYPISEPKQLEIL